MVAEQFDSDRAIGVGATRRLLKSTMFDDEIDAGVERIGVYEVERTLGRGGGGTTYLARQAESGRRVTLKVMRHQLGESAASRRAWRELDVLDEIESPYVPNLDGFGEHDGHLFIAYDYIDGVDLDTYAADRCSDTRSRVALIIEVANALQSVHEKGVIHRDIKPGNTIIDGNDRVHLIDFGIAAHETAREMSSVTMEGDPIGTPAFMAPEMARGEVGAMGTRSDVFGLGATAFRMLTGATVYDVDAPFHEAIRRVAQDVPRRARDLEPSIDRDLSAVLAKATASDPADRYGTPAAFAVELQRWLDGHPVEAHEVSMPRRTLMAMRRRPDMAAMVMLLVASISVAVVLGIQGAANGARADQEKKNFDALAAVVEERDATIAKNEELEDQLREAVNEKQALLDELANTHADNMIKRISQMEQLMVSPDYGRVERTLMAGIIAADFLEYPGSSEDLMRAFIGFIDEVLDEYVPSPDIDED